MRLLIKIGGTLLDADESRRRLAGEVAAAVQAGHQAVVVHGGGRQMTRFLSQSGIESRFIDGLRVTTPETVDAVLKVLAGSENKRLVAAMIERGAKAVGLSGVDGCLVEAELLRPELGQVGRPVRCNSSLFDCLVEAGYVPVVACVAGDAQGCIYNVNADQMAAACAGGFSAEWLVFLTDVDGVLGAGQKPLGRLSLTESEDMIRRGLATGGMQAKLNAAATALRNGIRQVVIAPGSAEQAIQRLLAGEALGTRLTP